MDDEKPAATVTVPKAADRAFRRIQELMSFIAEFSEEEDRAAVILGAARLDILLGQMLKAVLRPHPGKEDDLLDENSPLGTFSARIKMAHRLHLIDDAFARSLNLVRRIRNDFAHETTAMTLNSGGHRDRVRELVRPFKALSGWSSWVETFGDASKIGPQDDFRCALGLMLSHLDTAAENLTTMVPNRSVSLELATTKT